ncbi:MAG: TRAP-type mannitol/chloroaromatic compound transport system permease small subunit [Cyclobacteriaceae bacterium]|jgi:TRAP-type mannitol/chloroaromatic compound transport system permease small subunit
MKKISEIIDWINISIGKTVSWLSLVLVLVIVIDVFFRYTFNRSSPVSFELEWHIFAILFLLPMGWTLQQDRHVRVDVFYNRFSDRKKAIVNLIGSLFLLFPFCIIGVMESIPFVSSSFEMGETSADPGGLPARFIIKAMIPMCFFFLGLQAMSVCIRSIQTLTQKSDD